MPIQSALNKSLVGLIDSWPQQLEAEGYSFLRWLSIGLIEVVYNDVARINPCMFEQKSITIICYLFLLSMKTKVVRHCLVGNLDVKAMVILSHQNISLLDSIVLEFGWTCWDKEKKNKKKKNKRCMINSHSRQFINSIRSNDREIGMSISTQSILF